MHWRLDRVISHFPFKSILLFRINNHISFTFLKSNFNLESKIGQNVWNLYRMYEKVYKERNPPVIPLSLLHYSSNKNNNFIVFFMLLVFHYTDVHTYQYTLIYKYVCWGTVVNVKPAWSVENACCKSCAWGAHGASDAGAVCKWDSGWSDSFFYLSVKIIVTWTYIKWIYIQK